LRHLEIQRFELLAVAAPGRVELNQHILGVVDDEGLEGVSGNNLDCFGQVLWGIRFALDVNLRVGG
jgi:hypothetical protein